MVIAASDKIFVTGHRGLLGSAVVEELRRSGHTNLITCSRRELDLTRPEMVEKFLRDTRPKAVIHCAALVGGIQANSSLPAEFIHENLMMQTSVIHAAHLTDVETLMFFGSNCMYPTGSDQAMPEEMLLKGPVENSNLAYAAAKIAGFVQCQSYYQQYGRNYFTVIPASLYGPHDNFDLAQAHVTPALLLRVHQAKRRGDSTFTVWGSGKPRRELLFSGDAARGVRQLLSAWHASQGPVNLGAGGDNSVQEIAQSICRVVGFKGQLVNDTSKPDGAYRKLLDSRRAAAIGFKPAISLEEGLRITYDWLLSGAPVRGASKGEL